MGRSPLTAVALAVLGRGRARAGATVGVEDIFATDAEEVGKRAAVLTGNDVDDAVADGAMPEAVF